MLDYGCGSGVLGIAAILVSRVFFHCWFLSLIVSTTILAFRKFGADNVVGLDIDPLAVRSSNHNAFLNGISTEKFQIHEVDPTKGPEPSLNLQVESFDLVVANILVGPLIILAEKICSFAKSGAKVGLSGILVSQVQNNVLSL